jgi:LacI family transcriptional regulator
MTVPALTTLTQPFDEMCRRAIELIIAMRDGQRPVERRVVLAPDIIVRESTAALTATGSRGLRA